MNLDPDRTALLVIDLQNDTVGEEGAFGDSGAPAFAREHGVVENVMRLVEACRAARSTTPCTFAKAAAPDEANAPSSPTVSFCRSMTSRTVVRGSSLTR